MSNDRKTPYNALLRAAREERRWTQQQLANKINTTPVNVSRWENEQTFPSPHFRQQLCEIFEKTAAELGLVSETSSGDAKIWNMPNTRNSFFIGREPLLALLLERLSNRRVAALTQGQSQSQAQALFGLGGIGKTQTASEFAFRYDNYYTHVFWIKAADREQLVADYVALAHHLKLSEPQKDEQYQTRLFAAVKRWLSDNEGWLIIMDNADDLRMAQEFLPGRHKGYVLFTTRAQAAGQIAASIEVEKLTLEEGTLLLLRWSKRLDADAPLEQARTEDRAAAERIVQEVDGLPLAVVQAGAYIDETGCSPADYLRLYAKHRSKLLERPGKLVLGYTETVATTWSLSFQQIEQQSSTAANVLCVCAFLAPDAIPTALLTRGAAELSAIPGSENLDEFSLNEALAVLRKYSLLQRNSETSMLSIHRLVQAVLIDRMDEQTRRRWTERTVRVVNAAFPEGDFARDSPHQVYLPHIQQCAALITEYHLHFPEAVQLLYKAGKFLYHRRFYPESQALHQQALAIRQKVLGTDHPDVADSLNQLALLSRTQNQLEQAERYYRQALAIREKTFGMDNFETAITLNNLGVLYRNQGKYEQAEPLLQQALHIHERVVGPEHRETLLTLVNLAKLYLGQRNYEQAERFLKQALTTSEQALEPDNSLIAYNLSLLSKLSYEQGNPERAEELFLRSITIFEQTLGTEHPSIAESLNDFAKIYYAQGRFREAQAFCERAFNISKKTLGLEHADTIAYREHLSRIMNKIEEEQHGNHHAVPPSP